jgi:hypothetical protein
MISSFLQTSSPTSFLHHSSTHILYSLYTLLTHSCTILTPTHPYSTLTPTLLLTPTLSSPIHYTVLTHTLSSLLHYPHSSYSVPTVWFFICSRASHSPILLSLLLHYPLSSYTILTHYTVLTHTLLSLIHYPHSSHSVLTVWFFICTRASHRPGP